MLTALLILALLVLCGAIAYIGDLLGRRLGKKRLSVFGLRPKHTAILLTITTGVIIAGLTFASAVLVVPGFRQIVTRGERLVRENRTLERQNQLRRAEAERLTGENVRLSNQNAQVAGENRRLTGVNDELRKKSALLQRSNTELLASNAELQKGNTAQRADLARLRTEAALLNSQKQRLTQIIDRYRSEQREYQRGTYVYRRDQPIHSQVMFPNPGYQDLVRAIRTVIGGARQIVRRTPQAPRLDLTPDTNYRGPLTDEAMIAWTARRALNFKDQKLVIRVVAGVNVLSGKPVLGRLDVYGDALVLKKGSELFRAGVDGRGTEEYIIGELVNVLLDGVQRRLATAPISLANPDEALTTRKMLALYETTRRIKEINRPVTVVARVSRDTFRSGPAEVEMEIVPMPVAATGP